MGFFFCFFYIWASHYPAIYHGFHVCFLPHALQIQRMRLNCCLVCCGKCEWSETGNGRAIGQSVHMLAVRFLGCVTLAEMLMSDETWDKLVKRSRIIYSVIHFTSPCSECKLPQSFYFKPSFPSRGCRLPSLLPISLTFSARCPGGNRTPWDKERLLLLL